MPSVQKTFWGFAAIVLLSIFAAAATGWYWLAGIPAAALLVFLAIVDFRWIFFLLIACIPLSTEFYLPNGFGTDLPTEPLIVGLMLLVLPVFLKQLPTLGGHFLRHPITLLLLLHLGWIYITTLTSDLPFVSIKFALAKTWYVAVFYFLAGYLLKTERDIRRMFWYFLLPLLFTVAVILVRHAAYGFSFAEVYRVLSPFQRNHVNYAATLAMFVPFVFFTVGWYPRQSLMRKFLVGVLGLLLVAVYLSYTRAAYVALLIAAGTAVIFHFRLIRPVLLVGSIVALAGLTILIRHNRYLDLAPNYDRTISHEEFDNLIEATYKLEDISTMERLYRWVAGGHMVHANPFLGFGPGNFVNFYRSYTVTGFRTYVSDNEEQSGIHSYFLMTLVEQGIIGLALFVALVFYTLIRGERILHRDRDPRRRRLVWMALLCFVVINAFLLINDLVETDKIGSFFFLSLAILVNLDRPLPESSPPNSTNPD